jgi:hypothetical protein
LFLQPRAELRVAAVDLVGGDPGERDPRPLADLAGSPMTDELGRAKTNLALRLCARAFDRD